MPKLINTLPTKNIDAEETSIFDILFKLLFILCSGAPGGNRTRYNEALETPANPLSV